MVPPVAVAAPVAVAPPVDTPPPVPLMGDAPPDAAAEPESASLGRPSSQPSMLAMAMAVAKHATETRIVASTGKGYRALGRLSSRAGQDDAAWMMQVGRLLDRDLWVLPSSRWSRWSDALIIVKPATVIKWHRAGFRRYWAWRSRSKGGRPGIDPEIRKLIKQMANASLFRPIFAFFIIDINTKQVAHVGVTRGPTEKRTAQQLRNATPFGRGPQFIIRDRDDKYGAEFDRVAKGAGIRVIRTAVRAPRMNSVCERFLGSVRREALDHILILGERHMQRVLGEYAFRYHNYSRPHQGLAQRIPVPKPRQTCRDANKVVAIPVLGGLHHDYLVAA